MEEKIINEPKKKKEQVEEEENLDELVEKKLKLLHQREAVLIDLSEIKQKIKMYESQLPTLKKAEKACEDFLKLKKN